MHREARRNLEAHIAGERARDLEALLAPLSPHPRYVVSGWVLDGRDAVREMYRRAVPYLTPDCPTNTSGRSTTRELRAGVRTTS